MESQDGISVRPMRLKVLYTFDDASKTNCLARWPHLLEIQTAALDEKTQIGVIELKTCIQAIVSASPELVAKLGQDYTVYAYDYSEYETPLVGQGMLSWVLASSSPTPNAPAHQSKTMVTGRVCKNVLGLFSKGAQETLEVKLRLVPVPTVMQSEYLDSMQKYRELSNFIPHEFDAQAWTNFVRQNPALITSASTPAQPDRITSPMDHAGIEQLHRMLSEGSTPREYPPVSGNANFRSVSPSQSLLAPGSRVSTPGGQAPSLQQLELMAQVQQQPSQPQHQLDRVPNDAIRPSSSASMRDSDFQMQNRYNHSRRGSMQSGYGSGDEAAEQQPRKRAKLYRADCPGKSDLNIERQPSSLRVAASTAASVRIHRPTPINPAIAAAQNSNEEPVRPPTPISLSNNPPRRSRPQPSLLRESSVQSVQSTQSANNYNSPYPMSDDQMTIDPSMQSPEESRYQGLFEPSFTMPSSPPVLDCAFPTRSSPVLPPMVTDPDSGFMSGGMDDLLDEDIGTPLEDCTGSVSNNLPRDKRTTRPAVQPSSPAPVPAMPESQSETIVVDDEPKEQQPAKETTPSRPRAPASAAGSRPSSRASFRQGPKPLAPAPGPMSQGDIEQLINAIPASDPIVPHQPHAVSTAGPMSDFTAETPAPHTVGEDGKVRSGAGARRLRQVQARLDQCIKNGQVPPYCENCGVIETPTWRRAWSKELEGNEDEANEMGKDPLFLFWQSLERDDQEKVIKFKIFKKSLVDADNDFNQILLCNPCGLWLQKFKYMRPENKWNKTVSAAKRKRPPRNRRRGGPLSGKGQGAAGSSKVEGSSPAGSDASTPAGDEGATPQVDNGSENNKNADNNEQENDDDAQDPPSKRRRANSMEPRRSSDVAGSRWQEVDAQEALRRAIQSSPARNLENRNTAMAGENSLTPKRVRRVLFPNAPAEGGPLKALGESVLNSPRRSPRIASSREDKRPQDKENGGPSDLDRLFESPTFDFDLPTSPTPRRRNARGSEKRLSLPYNSPTCVRKDAASDGSPTKLSAQRLQRVQSSPGTPHQHKTPKSMRHQMPELPLPEDAFNSDAFEGVDNMIVDIFSDASVAQADSLFAFEAGQCPSSSWADWLPSDHISPNGSDEDHNGQRADDPNDLINALLSDPNITKENLNLDLFNLDSGFFSSDALQQEVLGLGVKAKTSDSTSEEPIENTNNV